MNNFYKKHQTSIALLISILTFSSTAISGNTNFPNSLKQDFQLTIPLVVQENHQWRNLYLQEASILTESINILNITKQQAIEKMSVSNKIEISQDASNKVSQLIIENTYLKDYFTPQYKQRVIDNPNEGQGVFIALVTSPNAHHDNTSYQGNYYSFQIFESYEEYNHTLAFIIFDLLTFKAYRINPIDANYLPLDLPTDLTKTLKQDILLKKQD